MDCFVFCLINLIWMINDLDKLWDLLYTKLKLKLTQPHW
jgi:RNAse (barnase) inhibitor barstar